MNKNQWIVHKFGGTSVLNAERIRHVSQIIQEQLPKGPKAIVVSAMKGVTDDLIRAVDAAKKNNQEYADILQKIKQRHQNEISNLLSGELKQNLLQVIDFDFNELTEILRSVWLMKTAADNIYEVVSGMGEVWSAQIINAYLNEQKISSTWLDARRVLVVNHTPQRVLVDWEKSQTLFNQWKAKNNFDLIVVTGYVASNPDGTKTTLGRNGSDYSGSIFGALMDCAELYIWTDVDGVLSADPRIVPEAIVLDEITYNEVTELAYFGAKIVHPSTMGPMIQKERPIWIKNTLNPKHPGTKIYKGAKSKREVTGFSTINEMCLINVEGTGMVGIPGVAERLFGSLRAAQVSVVLISQASSEQSICLAIPEQKAEVAKAAISESFAVEIQKGLIQNIHVTKNLSILAAVGDSMAQSPGISGKFFTALGRSGVNVRAIAQGSSERNISAVIDAKDSVKALRTVHSAFILPHQALSVGLIGPGLIGSTFLKQVHEQAKKLREVQKIDVQVRAIADSKKMYLSEESIDLSRWKDLFMKNAVDLNMQKFNAHVRTSHIPHAVIIESTASSEITPHYVEWFKEGMHVISPNKKANSGAMKDYLAIRESANRTRRHFLYSTNVGAGLPIIQTLKDLCATGDEVQMIQGVLSGTLSFIFNQYDGSKPFSQIVLEAKAKGYTEPDPREDLSGQDVMRKLIILARESGLKIEPSEVEVESLVPKSLQNISADEFLKRLAEMDQPMQEKMFAAKKNNQILRFVATLEKNGKARVRLESLPISHVFSRMSGTDNIVLFQTTRYFHQPLVVQGPGAGPEVTAAGVFADLLRLSQYLGASQ